MWPSPFSAPVSFTSPAALTGLLFMPVDEVRAKFPDGTKILVAIGGWGDTEGFSVAALDDKSRQAFPTNVARMVLNTGADGTFLSPANLGRAFAPVHVG